MRWPDPFVRDQNQRLIHIAVKVQMHNILTYIASLVVIYPRTAN